MNINELFNCHWHMPLDLNFKIERFTEMTCAEYHPTFEIRCVE